MLITPYQVALHTDHLESLTPVHAGHGSRWTWIAGRRFRGVRWL